MRARKFRRLRKKVDWYDVEPSPRLFGSFKWGWEDSTRVLARNHREACLRAQKRGIGLSQEVFYETKSERWANWRSKLSDKSDNFKHIKYF